MVRIAVRVRVSGQGMNSSNHDHDAELSAAFRVINTAHSPASP